MDPIFFGAKMDPIFFGSRPIFFLDARPKIVFEPILEVKSSRPNVILLGEAAWHFFYFIEKK